VTSATFPEIPILRSFQYREEELQNRYGAAAPAASSASKRRFSLPENRISPYLEACAARKSTQVKKDRKKRPRTGHARAARAHGSCWRKMDGRAKLPADGEYTVQVYLMRNAARRNAVASYRLEMDLRD
jgi:cell division septation protein DedD